MVCPRPTSGHGRPIGGSSQATGFSVADRLPRVTSDEVLRALARDGWFISRQSGSHAVLRHPTRRGRVVVPRHRGKTLKLATIASILEQAGLSAEEFRELL